MDPSRPDSPSLHVIYCLLFPVEAAPLAKQFWQHTGLGVSSRYAEHCLRLLEVLPPVSLQSRAKSTGRGRYKDDSEFSQHLGALHERVIEKECEMHIDERFARHLDVRFMYKATQILKGRIAGILGDAVGVEDAEISAKEPHFKGLSDSDVFLFPSGMSAIYQALKMARTLLPDLKSVQFGFPYIDTLKLQEKFGPGCHFFGHGDASDLAELEKNLEVEQISALICEFPSNPLLRSPPLDALWALANKHGFILIVDETVGNPVNISCLASTHLIVSSLTKVFSGDSNVMAGAVVLNPLSDKYEEIKRWMVENDQRDLWCEDILVLERNSRTFESRIKHINSNAESLCDAIKSHPNVDRIYYPKYYRENYDKFATGQGFGGLFSIVLMTEQKAIAFYDKLQVLKGPSLGTNFTLACPYTILAHYNELGWAAEFGVPKHLIRVSVGLEDTKFLVAHFLQVLDDI